MTRVRIDMDLTKVSTEDLIDAVKSTDSQLDEIPVNSKRKRRRKQLETRMEILINELDRRFEKLEEKAVDRFLDASHFVAEVCMPDNEAREFVKIADFLGYSNFI